MTLAEAIDELKVEAEFEEAHGTRTMVEALYLGIEAGKREIRHRQEAKSDHVWLLPGETKD